MTRLILGGALAAAILGAPAAGSAEPGSPPAAPPVLALLHDGRFDAADALLEAAPSGSSDPETLFFRAFVTYWRLLYDEDDLALRARLGEQVAATIACVDAARGGGPAAALWGGSAHLLLAQLRAIEKKPFGAAIEAKRARKDLAGLGGGDDLAGEALFGLGTYNYMADRLPAFVKGLRSLLFLPGGDRDLGLAQLGRAARGSRYFSVEARLLLVTIHANRHERLFDVALEQAAYARAAEPDALVVAHASAKLLIALARPREAAALLDRALARAAGFGDVDPVVVATLELLRARADFGMFRPDLAAARADALRGRKDRLPADVREDARVLAIESGSLVSRPWWPEAYALVSGGPIAAGNGKAVAPTAAAERAAVLDLLNGRALLVAGRPAEALDRLAAAESSGHLPTPWVGPCRLLAGQAADLAGLRPRALAYYRKAATSPGFLARDAAHAFQARPFETAAP